MKSVLIICVALVYNNVFAQTISKAWIADNGNGTFKNPVVNADYSDPDAIRVAMIITWYHPALHIYPAYPFFILKI